MRNNQDRLGAPEVPNTSEPAPALTQQGADFSFVAANDIVELPSGGEQYPEGHSLRNNPRVEIKQMTAKEEDILLNESYIKQGVVVEKLLQSLIVDKSLNLDDLLIGDKNAILVQVRRSAYGDEYPVQMVCRNCGKPGEQTFILEDCVRPRGVNLIDGVKTTDRGTYEVTMPKSKAVVEFKLLTQRDEKDLAEKEKKYAKHNVQYSATLEAYKALIVSVNGQTNLIDQYLENMPLQDSRMFKKIIKEVPPNVELIGTYECGSCGSQNETELPINFRFFWPDF